MSKPTINTFIESYTPPLPLFKVQGEPQVTLELKPYIQPFERVLAKAELAGLLGLKVSLETEAKPYVTLYFDNVSMKTLQRRLAYWQRIGDDVLEPTLQIRYEVTSDKENRLFDDDITNLPKSRRLRYGPHGIHEYRGKFFPQLVKALVNSAGLPEGATVLDPMCGSGTTICEARTMGMKSIGVDLNPLSVEISQLKAGLLSITPEQLQSGLKQLQSELKQDRAPDLERLWSKRDLDYLLRWFNPKALDEIAVIRTVISAIENPTVRKMAEIGLSNILRSVSWQSDTDLRVRKKVTGYAEGAASQTFIEEITHQQEKLFPYLSLLQDAGHRPHYEVIVGDARHLDSLLPTYVGACDAIVTSPPYATALPYIDTDRLSLIVLGLLPRQEHRNREFQLIGNREVTEAQRQKLWATYQARKGELPNDVCQLIDRIAKSNHNSNVGFRKRNLPALLAKYFLDMADAFYSAHQMMRPGAYAFYVVGNNSTTINGNQRIEIPTNEFLWQIGKRVGWIGEQLVDMELLPSRDIFRHNRGSKETILVFKAQQHLGNRTPKAIYSRMDRVEQQIDGAEWNFHSEETQPHLHALHPYPARFIPQIPRKAISEWSKKGEVVLDPFCGCGTTILESILLGRTAMGVDNNEVAHLISQAKTAHYTRDDLCEIQQFLADVPLGMSEGLQKGVPKFSTNVWIPDFKNLDYWFDEDAILELGRLKTLIEQLTARPRILALAVFSSIIVSVSYQDSDTRYARINRPYRPDDVEKRFTVKLTDAIGRARKIIDCPKAESKLYLNDSRNLSQIQSESVSLIVTSPPYLNAYDYHKYHRQRLHWIEGNIKLARDYEIGKHDTFTRPNAIPDPYFEDMRKCFAEWARVLRPNGHAFIVIGDAIVNGQPIPVADRFIEILTQVGFQCKKQWIRQIPESKKSFNRRNSRINEEHILLLQLR